MAEWLAAERRRLRRPGLVEEQGTIAMSGLLLAAAMTGATMDDGYQWTQRRGQERACRGWRKHGNPQRMRRSGR